MVGAFLVKKGRSGKYWYLFGQGFGLLIDDFAGGKLGFELFDNLSMHLLVDLDLLSSK